MTDDEVLSQPIAWRGEGDIARKRKQAGKMKDFTNYNDWSKKGPRKRFGGVQGCRVDKNDMPERLGPLPGSKTLENDRKSGFFRISRILGVENA